MGLVVDLIVIAAFALSVFLGYKKGLVGVAFKIISFIAAIVLAFILCTPVSELIINNTEFDDNIHKTIQTTLEAKPVEETEHTEEENSNISSVITDYVANEVKKATSEKQNEVANVVATSLTKTIIKAITFIGIFIVARVILFFFKFLAESLAELPILKQFNEAGGIAYGVLRGAFIIYLAFAIIALLHSILNLNGLIELINTSYLSKFLYDNNLLLKILF